MVYTKYMIYDVAIIGAGPAGLMAGISAAELGAKVILIEKNERPGLKLLTTGGSRCNLTNAIYNPKELADKYGDKGKFLISGFSFFGVQETLDFFNKLGLVLKIEKNNQVFPESNRSTEVLKFLLTYFKRQGGELLSGSPVRNLVIEENKIKSIFLNNNQEIKAHHYIIASGGKSYPATGSSGDAYAWLKKAGHQIITPQPALSPIIVRDNLVKKLEGISLEEASLSLYEGVKKIKTISGGIVFTANGVSGPAALNLSSYITKTEGLTLKIDFLPQQTIDDLDKYLCEIFSKQGAKLFRNTLDGLITPKLQYLLGDLLNIKNEKTASVINKEERKKIVNFLKNFSLTIKSIGGFDRAMVTRGGVSLKEVNPKNMQSKIIDNLSLAGEILDLDGPTGGYNLQICWTTGHLAGLGAVKKRTL